MVWPSTNPIKLLIRRVSQGRHRQLEFLSWVCLLACSPRKTLLSCSIRSPSCNGVPHSVSGKLFRSDVVLVNAGAHKHFSHAHNHGGRSGNVIDGSLQVGEMSRQHLFVIKPVSPFHSFWDCGISVMVHTNWKFGLLFSSV